MSKINSNLIQEDLNNLHSIITNEIDSKVEDVYSTSEVKTNKVWIDGKPIYKRVFSVNTPSTANTYTTVANMGSNIDQLITTNGLIKATYSSTMHIVYNLNFDEGDNSHFGWVAYNQKNGDIQLNVGNSLKNMPVIITIEYTKTTD